MFGSPRISTKELAALCRHLATSLEAGIDARKVWASEAERTGRSVLRGTLRTVSQEVNRGQSVAEALAATGDFFPAMFRQLAEVGEQTGHLAEVLAQLADHYDNQVRLRRLFLAAITWPVAELAIAVVVVGLLIWIMGVIGQPHGQKIDPLGFGLVGNRGLAIYVALVTGVLLLFAAAIHAARRGLLWVKPIQRAVLRVPVLGTALETLAMARLTWSLHLTLNTEINVRRALTLSLQSAGSVRLTDHAGAVDAALADGNSIAEALSAAGVFPADFLAAVSVGEQTGNLVESMALLSRQYQDRARAALATLTTLGGVAVWMLVAAMIIVLIFRLALFYVGAIRGAMGPL